MFLHKIILGGIIGLIVSLNFIFKESHLDVDYKDEGDIDEFKYDEIS